MLFAQPQQLFALSLSACSTVDLDKDKAGSITDGTSVEEALSSKTGPLANREVHFDFDSYTVSPDQMPVVTNHAQFLAAHKNLNVRLEGNTDERGGREYNLALGQKRAEAVKERMTLLGVSPQQIETISYGKENPKPKVMTKRLTTKTAELISTTCSISNLHEKNRAGAPWHRSVVRQYIGMGALRRR